MANTEIDEQFTQCSLLFVDILKRKKLTRNEKDFDVVRLCFKSPSIGGNWVRGDLGALGALDN